MDLENGVVLLEDWRTTMIVSLYKDKREWRECKNYKDICLLNIV